MKRFFQYFGFNQIERLGFIVLSAIIILVLFIPYFFKLLNNTEPIPYELVYFDSDNKEKSNNYSSNSSERNPSLLSNKRNKDIVYFKFDPNDLDENSWSKLGFSDKQIKVIKNYESKGGKFYKKEDVAKIFVISEKDYKRIEPYIEIDKSRFSKNELFSKNDNSNSSDINKKSNLVVDINNSDTTAWKSLPGIGSTFAKRIVKYRDVLGGFNSIEQLSEVYGLDAEKFLKIKPFLHLMNPVKLTRLNVNNVSVELLAKHPYISKKQAQTIVNYRGQHGNFKNLESLLSIQSFDKDFLRKIEPYLEF